MAVPLDPGKTATGANPSQREGGLRSPAVDPGPHVPGDGLADLEEPFPGIVLHLPDPIGHGSNIQFQCIFIVTGKAKLSPGGVLDSKDVQSRLMPRAVSPALALPFSF